MLPSSLPGSEIGSSVGRNNKSYDRWVVVRLLFYMNEYQSAKADAEYITSASFWGTGRHHSSVVERWVSPMSGVRFSLVPRFCSFASKCGRLIDNRFLVILFLFIYRLLVCEYRKAFTELLFGLHRMMYGVGESHLN